MALAKKKTSKKKTATKKKIAAKKKTATKKKITAEKKTATKKKIAAEKKAVELVEAAKAEEIKAPAVPIKEHPPLSRRIKKADLRIIHRKLLQRRDELAGTIVSIESEHL